MIINFSDPAVIATLKRNWVASMVEALKGYGYDTTANRVVSFKLDKSGRLFDRRTSYRLNGQTVYHEFILAMAGYATREPELTKASSSLASLTPTTEYIMFSKKLQCSQYFRKGTSIESAVALFARRDIVIDLNEVTLLNPTTMKEIKIKPVVTTTYVLE